jgi:hypothetical protein
MSLAIHSAGSIWVGRTIRSLLSTTTPLSAIFRCLQSSYRGCSRSWHILLLLLLLLLLLASRRLPLNLFSGGLRFQRHPASKNSKETVRRSNEMEQWRLKLNLELRSRWRCGYFYSTMRLRKSEETFDWTRALAHHASSWVKLRSKSSNDVDVAEETNQVSFREIRYVSTPICISVALILHLLTLLLFSFKLYWKLKAGARTERIKKHKLESATSVSPYSQKIRF